MSERIEIDEIQTLIPHRYPFLLVDRVLEYAPHDYLMAIKNVSINEPFFAGHFPGRPIMPGVLMLEALAQACAILSSKSLGTTVADEREFLHFFAGIDNARFKQVVSPGDQLILEVKTLATKRNIWKMHAQAKVNGNIACSAELMSALKEVTS